MAHSLNPNKIIILDNDINKLKNVKNLVLAIHIMLMTTILKN